MAIAHIGQFERRRVELRTQALARRQHRDADVDHRRQRARRGETHLAECPCAALRQHAQPVRQRGPRGFQLHALRQTRMALNSESADARIVGAEAAEILLLPGFRCVAMDQRMDRMRMERLRRRRDGSDHWLFAPVALPGERIDRQVHASGQGRAV